jgi:hypothetical protein
MAMHFGEITTAFPGGGGIAGASTARTTPAASPYQVMDAPPSSPLPSASPSACVQLKLEVLSLPFCLQTETDAVK